MELKTMRKSLKEKDRGHLARDTPIQDLEVVKTEGAFVVDRQGKKYIDFLMGWFSGNSGWGNREIRSAYRRFTGPDYVNPNYLYAAWADLAESLAKICPGKLRKCYRAVGGTEAVEIAMQLAIAYTGRAEFISIEGSYHGNSLAAKSLGASKDRAKLKTGLPNCHKLPPSFDSKALAGLEALLRRRRIAAFVMEPVIVNLGVLIPPPDFMRGLQRLCRRHGALLIMDEVACGFGRTGKWFASEHFSVEPDILCVAKSLSGGYAPIGAAIATDEVAGTNLDFFSTFGWHPLSVAVALAHIKYLKKNERKWLANAREQGASAAHRLAGMDFRQSVKIRALGLALGLGFPTPRDAWELRDRCRQAGLILGITGDSLLIFPPLNIDAKTLTRGLDILEECARNRAPAKRAKARP